MNEKIGVKVFGPTSPLLLERELQSYLHAGHRPTPGGITIAPMGDGSDEIVVVMVYVVAEGKEVVPRAPAPARGEFVPRCPMCKGAMVERYRKMDNKRFWGCATFPGCRGILTAEAGDEEAQARPWVPPPPKEPESHAVGSDRADDDSVPF
jgi:hypothetical protein